MGSKTESYFSEEKSVESTAAVNRDLLLKKLEV